MFVISPDGSLLAYCVTATVSLYDAKTDCFLREVRAHEHEINSLAFSPSGKLLATANKKSDIEVRIWDVATLTELHTLTDQRRCVQTLAFSPDGKFFVTGSIDSEIRVYDVDADFKFLGSVSHDSVVRELTFAKDGTLASLSHDKTVRLWNVKERKDLARMTIEKGDVGDFAFLTIDYGKLAFSPTDDLLAIALPPRLILWNYKTGEQHEVRHSPGSISDIPLPNDETFELPAPPAKPEKKPPDPRP